MLPLREISPLMLPDGDPPCAAIDIHAELRFWESCYARQSFHRPGTPFRHYVPTLKFAYDTYLLAHRETLEDLMPTLLQRYERSLPCGARLEWSVVHDIVVQVWRRVHAPLHGGMALPPLPPEALDERAIVAAAMNRH